MGGYLGGRGMAIFWSVVVLVLVLRLASYLLSGRVPRGEESWLQDKAWEGMNRVDTRPEWMKGRFGAIVNGLFVGIFLLVGVIAAIHVLIYGPAKPQATANATANASANHEKPTGGF